MQFSVIYEFDVPKDHSVRVGMPKNRHLFNITETGESEVFDNGGKHRKLCALLSKEQFETFLNSVCLGADSTETMGSIGAPGFGIGWAPAIAFTDGGQYDFYASAYVTPIPEVERKDGFTERDWQRVRKAVISLYA